MSLEINKECDISKEKKCILKELEDKKEKLDKQIKIIEDLKIEPVTEEKWHELCKTPVRSNDILLDIARSTFPDGDCFVLHLNEVSFILNGFDVKIPTSNTKGITINMRWYNKYLPLKDSSLEPKDRYGHMRAYFNVLDSGKYTWYDLAKLRCDIAPHHYNKFELFIWWFTICKRSKVNREEWEKKFEIEDEENKNGYDKHKEMKSEMKTEIKKFHNTVDILKEWGEVKGYIPCDSVWSNTNVESFLR